MDARIRVYYKPQNIKRKKIPHYLLNEKKGSGEINGDNDQRGFLVMIII